MSTTPLSEPQKTTPQPLVATPRGRIIWVGYGNSNGRGSAINGALAREVVSNIIECDLNSNEPILFVVCSPGGEVNSGMAVVDAISMCRSPTVGLVLGNASSMAAHIWLATDTRLIAPQSTVLFHDPTTGADGKVAAITDSLDDIKAATRVLRKHLQDRSSMSKDDVEALMSRDRHLTAKDAVKLGIAHKISATWGDVVARII